MQIDQSLIKSCVENNPQAQKQVYLILLPYLRAVASRYLRDTSYTVDVLQESFVKIFKNIGKYDAERAPLKSWSARIVINTSLNYNERVIDVYTEELKTEIHEQPILESDFEKLGDSELMKLLKKMPAGYFEVFNLFVIDGYSHKEITTILGISDVLSRKKLSRAKGWLKKRVPKYI